MKSYVVLLIPGWSHKTGEENFKLFRKRLEDIPGVQVVVADYGVHGFLSKFRTRDGIEEYTDIVECVLKDIEEQNPGVPIIAIGHSMGGLILRLLFNRGHRFRQMIFAGTPHKGFNPFFRVFSLLARLCGVKPFFEMAPVSHFILSLGQIPSGIYIGGKKDGVVPIFSAIPAMAGRKIVLHNCGHAMFPQEEEQEKDSAIPVVVGLVEKLIQNVL